MEKLDLSDMLGHSTVKLPGGKEVKVDGWTIRDQEELIPITGESGFKAEVIYRSLKSNYEITREDIQNWPASVSEVIMTEISRLNRLEGDENDLIEAIKEFDGWPPDKKKKLIEEITGWEKLKKDGQPEDK